MFVLVPRRPIIQSVELNDRTNFTTIWFTLFNSERPAYTNYTIRVIFPDAPNQEITIPYNDGNANEIKFQLNNVQFGHHDFGLRVIAGNLRGGTVEYFQSPEANISVVRRKCCSRQVYSTI